MARSLELRTGFALEQKLRALDTCHAGDGQRHRLVHPDAFMGQLRAG
jgi:hypothetical protein